MTTMSPIIFGSLQDSPSDLPLSPEPQSLATPPKSSVGDVRPSSEDQHETQLQACWDKSIAKHMKLWEGYHDVHVLMVKWNDDIDDLKVKAEVEELTGVFEDVFNYPVVLVELNMEKPQQRLDYEISKWVYEKDAPDSLLIVYYAGHGIYHPRTNALEIAPKYHEEPQVVWSRSEKPFIETAKADVFMIMDCCYASDIMRSQPTLGRTFEMLCASQIGRTTPEPGEKSFTHCLIKLLKELGEEPYPSSITSYDIDQRMRRDLEDNPPALWQRIPGTDRHIRLRKLKPVQDRPVEIIGRSQYSQFLHLGFALKRECFNEQHIENLTKQLPQLFAKADLPLVNIKWLGCRKAGGSRFKELVQMYMVRSRSDAFVESPVSGTKRTLDEVESDGAIEHVPKRVNVLVSSVKMSA